MDRSEIRSLLHDVIAVETEPFSVRVATLASAIDRIEAALRAARAEGIKLMAVEAGKVVHNYDNGAGCEPWKAGESPADHEAIATEIHARARALLTKESGDAAP